MGKDRLSGVFRFRAQPVIGLRFHIEGAVYQPLLGQHGLEHGMSADTSRDRSW